MVATAQRFAELNPGVQIAWEKRSLRAFEDYPVERLTADYDLIVLDHPSVGQGAHLRALLPLDEHLGAEFLEQQAAGAVGASHASYAYDGHQWALAIDASTPVAFWRDDMMAALGLSPPGTWEDMLALARRGCVEVPATPINCLMNLYSLCLAQGETPFAGNGDVASPEAGRSALAHLRELLSLCDPGCWTRNPIASHDLVASAANTRLCYCPLAYGYSNYARAGFADRRLSFGEPPQFRGKMLRTTLGGAGIGLSAVRPHRREALAYAQFVASPAVQRTLYTHSGGQPASRQAWLDPENNRLTGEFFARTLPAVDRAYLRPRHSGSLVFQHRAGPVVQAALRGQLGDAEALRQVGALYRETVSQASPCV
jgi:multiple sugar transport system substrate-binding protein